MTDHVSVLVVVSCVVGQIAEKGAVQHARVNVACGVGRRATHA